MGKGKPRWYPEKKQNKYGSVCRNLDCVGESNEHCDLMPTMDTKICKGNRHNCVKIKYKKLAIKQEEY